MLQSFLLAITEHLEEAVGNVIGLLLGYSRAFKKIIEDEFYLPFTLRQVSSFAIPGASSDIRGPLTIYDQQKPALVKWFSDHETTDSDEISDALLKTFYRRVVEEVDGGVAILN